MQVISPDFEDHMRELFERPKDRERERLLKFKSKQKDKKKKVIKPVKPVKKGRK